MVDPVEALIKSRQWVDWTETRYEDATSGKYLRDVDALVIQIRDFLDEAPHLGTLEAVHTSDDGSDLLDHMNVLTNSIGELEVQINDLKFAFEATLGVLSEGSPKLDRSSNPSVIQVELKQLGKRLGPYIEKLKGATEKLSKTQSLIGSAIDGLIKETAESSPLGSELESMISGLGNIDLAINREELDEGREMLRMFGRLSKDMRRPMESIDDSIQVMIDMASMPDAWRGALEIARRRRYDR